MKRRAIRPQEGERAVGPTHHAESAFVDGAMVTPAESRKVPSTNVRPAEVVDAPKAKPLAVTSTILLKSAPA